MTKPRRRSGEHGRLPLSTATRTRLLAGLLARAENGDVPAAEALIRLSLQRQVGALAQPGIVGCAAKHHAGIDP